MLRRSQKWFGQQLLGTESTTAIYPLRREKMIFRSEKNVKNADIQSKKERVFWWIWSGGRWWTRREESSQAGMCDFCMTMKAGRLESSHVSLTSGHFPLSCGS